MASITSKKQRKRKVFQLFFQKCDQISNFSFFSSISSRIPLRIQVFFHKKNRFTDIRYRYFQIVDDKIFIKFDLNTIVKKFDIDESTDKVWRRNRIKFDLNVVEYRHRIRKRKFDFEKMYRLFDDTIDKFLNSIQNKKRSERYSEHVRNSEFKVCRKCEPDSDCQKFKSSKFETSTHETINFTILVIRHSYRISARYSCAKTQKFISLNRQNEYILRSLQGN